MVQPVLVYVYPLISKYIEAVDPKAVGDVGAPHAREEGPYEGPEPYEY